MPDDSIKDASPYPSAAEMDLDMWRATAPARIVGGKRHGFVRYIKDLNGEGIVAVYPGTNDGERDVTARRVEGMGDLYEALRRAAERMIEAGMDVSDEHRALTEFVSPKPFAEGQ